MEGENGDQSLVEGQMGVVDEGDERRWEVEAASCVLS